MPLVLVVEDDELCARGMALELRRRGIDTRIAASGAELPHVVAEAEWGGLDGALVDVGLPDTCGTEIAAGIREKNPRANIALVSGCVSEQQVRTRIIALNVPLFTKPLIDDELDAWVRGIVARSPWARFEDALERLSEEHGVTKSEIDVVRAAHDVDPEYKAIAAHLNRAVETVRSHGKNILRKTGASSLRELLKRLTGRL